MALFINKQKKIAKELLIVVQPEVEPQIVPEIKPDEIAVTSPIKTRELTIRERVDMHRKQMQQAPPPKTKEIKKSVDPIEIPVEKSDLKIPQLPIGRETILYTINNSPFKLTQLSEYDKQFKLYAVKYENINTLGLLDFRAFIFNKTIALVANSSILLSNKYGAEIDAHDIVVRFNSYIIMPDVTGEKTTIHASIHLQDINLDKYIPIRIIIAPNLQKWANKVDTINPYKQGEFLNYFNYYALTRKALSETPFTTGFNIFLLLNFIGGFQKISMYGFDLYSKDGEKRLRTKEGMEHDISLMHNYTMEREIIIETADVVDKKYNNYGYYGNRSL